MIRQPVPAFLRVSASPRRLYLRRARARRSLAALSLLSILPKPSPLPLRRAEGIETRLIGYTVSMVRIRNSFLLMPREDYHPAQSDQLPHVFRDSPIIRACGQGGLADSESRTPVAA